MANTDSTYSGTEADIKAQAEQVLLDLGIPMSKAIDLFLYNVVLHKGLPFDVEPPTHPLDVSLLTPDEFNAEMEKGEADINADRIMPSAQVRDNMKRKYGI